MSVAKLRELLRELGADDRLTLAEVQRLIEASKDDDQVTPGELFLLQAAMLAHAGQFTPDAYAALKAFLDSRSA